MINIISTLDMSNVYGSFDPDREAEMPIVLDCRFLAHQAFQEKKPESQNRSLESTLNQKAT